jgi:hypothetical protein
MRRCPCKGPGRKRIDWRERSHWSNRRHPARGVKREHILHDGIHRSGRRDLRACQRRNTQSQVRRHHDGGSRSRSPSDRRDRAQGSRRTEGSLAASGVGATVASDSRLPLDPRSETRSTDSLRSTARSSKGCGARPGKSSDPSRPVPHGKANRLATVRESRIARPGRDRRRKRLCRCAMNQPPRCEVNDQIRPVAKPLGLTLRRLSALGVCVATCVAVVGCGGRDASQEPVAWVRARPITRAALDHWIHIAAVRDFALFPKTFVPDGLVPDPPTYEHCVAYLAEGSAALPHERLKRQCARRYAALKRQVLGALIGARWLIQEGEAHGFTVTRAEERHRYETTIRRQVGGAAAVAKYFAITGETASDQLFRARIKLMSTKLEQEVLGHRARGESPARALGRYFEALPRRLTAHTRCSKGYVIPECREYRGKASPQLDLL